MRKLLFLLVCLSLLLSSCALTTVQALEQKRREDYIRINPDIEPRYKEAILSAKIMLGMSSDQVLASWGRPDKIHRSVGRWGVHEQWIYGKTPYAYYLYFENDKLVSWQE